MNAQTVNFTPEQITALFIDAAREGDTDLLTQFLDAGMVIDTPDSRGYTALIVSTYNGHLEAARLLLARGANTESVDLKGATALSGVAFKGMTDIAQVLIDNGAQVDHANFSGRTPLMFAIMFGRTDMARLLLSAGANPDHRDGDGVSARDLAERQGVTGFFDQETGA
ncbi:MAG: ankyrin repeat domain-containing protein [Gluconobacter cerinus]|uniref:ankyrin repeat domain-containing protein n=1 Tax=Gluconobacter cerinus TaxID=38307 RepID=UPI0039EAA944